MNAEDVRAELAEVLGAMPEAVNVFDYTDEATTMLTAPVDLIADVVLASDWLAEYVAIKQADALRDRGMDPTPPTTGEPFQHPRGEVIAGRVCKRLADGTGWWPMRWEDGRPNPWATSFCLGVHADRVNNPESSAP